MKTLGVIIFTLIQLNFFGLFNYLYVTYIISIYFIYLFVVDVWIKQKFDKYLTLSFSMIMIGLILSMISSNHYEGSKYWDVFRSYQFIFSILYFVFLARKKTSKRDFEKALEILCLLFGSFYVLQFILYQMGYSMLATSSDNFDRGLDVRIRIIGSALSSLGYFYGLCRIWACRGRKNINYTLLILGLSITLLMAFRTMIVGLLLGTIVLAIKMKGFVSGTVRTLIISGFLGCALYCIPIVQQKVDYMVAKQQGDENFDNDDYIRLINLDYHLNEYFQSDVEYFLGSGINRNPKSSLYVKNDDLAEMHMDWVDWGIFGLSWMVGTLTVIGMLFYSLYVICRKYPKEAQYIPVFFIYLLMISITTNEFARTGNFVVQALVLYISYIYNKENKSLNENRNCYIS